MDSKYQVDDKVKVNGFSGIYIVVGMEYDDFLGEKDMIFYDLESVENGQMIRTYEHNIREI